MIESIKKALSQNKEILVKIYSMEYIIKKENNLINIYPKIYPDKKAYYETLEDLLKNYKIYNENIADNIDDISIISTIEIL